MLSVAGLPQSEQEPDTYEEEAEAASDRDYDAEEAGFNDDRYQYEEPDLRAVPDSTVRRLKRDKDFAYANDSSLLPNREAVPEDRKSFAEQLESFLGTGLMRIMGYILLIAFFLFVIYRIIVNNNLFEWRRNRKVRSVGEAAVEALEEEDLEGKLRQAIADKNYRAAVRYQYIKGLRLLSDKGWIRFHAQATNHDYMQQVSKYPVSSEFRFLTQVYDYVWYGEFPVNDEQFARLHSDFQRFYQSVGS